MRRLNAISIFLCKYSGNAIFFGITILGKDEQVKRDHARITEYHVRPGKKPFNKSAPAKPPNSQRYHIGTW